LAFRWRALGELVGWTIRVAGHAGRELDGIYLHHRHDEFRRRMVGKPIGYSPLQRRPQPYPNVPPAAHPREAAKIEVAKRGAGIGGLKAGWNETSHEEASARSREAGRLIQIKGAIKKSRGARQPWRFPDREANARRDGCASLRLRGLQGISTARASPRTPRPSLTGIRTRTP
jgi:hypothetical protein